MRGTKSRRKVARFYTLVLVELLYVDMSLKENTNALAAVFDRDLATRLTSYVKTD
ncbi:hypothetical protein ABHI18_007558 [Aspergillus niger]